LRRGRRRKKVVFYGHRLAGNLFPVHRKLVQEHGDRIDTAFLTMDPGYFRLLESRGERVIFAVSPAAVAWLARVDAIVTDHGLHAMRAMLPLGGVKFFDAWHGIPFKGFDPADFRDQRRYDETWVASPLMADIYRDAYGFAPERVFATGYARTDALVDGSVAAGDVRQELGIPDGAKVVLFAPTWRQDDPRRSPYPFGVPADEFLGRMSAFAARHGVVVVVRGHLNEGGNAEIPHPGLMSLAFAEYPWTERLLQAVDVLVCDWSSIAFDYLLLDRPAIFLDVPAPFAKGFTLDASWRYGEVVGSCEALLAALEHAVADPAGFMADHEARMRDIRTRVYGGMDDGKATGRCVRRLLSALGE
jgi:CDP-glycerol glycerophosphotransferase